ncbi:hypothetical protein F66182_4655 [Fusarium sp. NRRL 66182]|nr:hypothetical protein F66182_4655 [Fusarium sp. NRRL 66182]
MRRLPLNPPPVSLTLQQEISHDQSEKLLTILGNGSKKEKVGRTPIDHAPNLASENLDKIHPCLGSSFQSFASVAELLRTHRCFAFTLEDDESRMELQELVADRTASYSKFKKNDKTNFAKYANTLATLEEEEDGEGDGDVPMSDDQQALRTTLTGSTGGEDMVLVAKPPKILVDDFGPSNSIPQSPGILFPCFEISSRSLT